MYTLYRFGTLTLPDEMPTDDNSTAPYSSAGIALSTGGAFDSFGSDQSYPAGTYKLTKACSFHFTSSATMRTYFNALRAMTGQKTFLFRQWDSGVVEWVMARLLRVDAEREVENKYHLEATLEFEIYSHYWHGSYLGAWTFDAGYYFDTGLYFDSGGDSVTLNVSPKSFTITISGNAIINDPTITVTAGSANITALEIKNTTTGHLAEIDFTGTITASESLVIDCGAYTVENDGSDAESDFALGSTHAIEEWFRLAPGANTITVTITGGSTDSTIDFDYYEGWK